MTRIPRVACAISTQIGQLDCGDVWFGAFGGNVGRLAGVGNSGVRILVVVFDVSGMRPKRAMRHVHEPMLATGAVARISLATMDWNGSWIDDHDRRQPQKKGRGMGIRSYRLR